MRDNGSPEAGELSRKLQSQGNPVLDVKVTPRAAIGGVMGWMAGGALNVNVIAVPERGKANEEVCELLARYLTYQKEALR